MNPSDPAMPMTPERLAEIRIVARKSLGYTTANPGSPDYIALSNACDMSRGLDECLAEIDRLQAQVKSAREVINESMNRLYEINSANYDNDDVDRQNGSVIFTIGNLAKWLKENQV